MRRCKTGCSVIKIIRNDISVVANCGIEGFINW